MDALTKALEPGDDPPSDTIMKISSEFFKNQKMDAMQVENIRRETGAAGSFDIEMAEEEVPFA